MKKMGVAVLLAAALSGPIWASRELCLKAAFVLNRGGEATYSWMLIQESNYFVGERVSFGYETQFSFYKAGADNPGGSLSIYPINVFLNSKVRLIRSGAFRPYLGAGFGLYSNVRALFDHYEWEKALGTQVIAGISIGVGEKSALQVEVRMMNADLPGFKSKIILAAGMSY